jgi:hypothetical protein
MDWIAVIERILVRNVMKNTPQRNKAARALPVMLVHHFPMANITAIGRPPLIL